MINARRARDERKSATKDRELNRRIRKRGKEKKRRGK